MYEQVQHLLVEEDYDYLIDLARTLLLVDSTLVVGGKIDAAKLAAAVLERGGELEEITLALSAEDLRKVIRAAVDEVIAQKEQAND